MEFQYLDGGNSEVQDMQAEAYLYASSGTTGIAATGVIEGLVVAQTSTASGSVLISAGACVNQASLGQGASRLINPSQKTLDIFTANPVAGLARRDIVVFDSVTKLIIAKIGVPNATPTDPTVAATEVALWRLRHDASATTIFTAHMDDLRVFTTLRPPVMPHVRFRASVGGSRAGAALNAVQLDAIGETSGATVATVSGYQVTVSVAGLYNLEGSVTMSSSAFVAQILNVTTGAVLTGTKDGSGALNLTTSLSTTRRLAAGTALQLQVYPAATSTVTADAAGSPSCLSVTKLSD